MFHNVRDLLRLVALSALLCITLTGVALAQPGSPIFSAYANIDSSGNLPAFANARYVLNGGAATSVPGDTTANNTITRLIADNLNYDIKWGLTGVQGFSWAVINTSTSSVRARMRIRFWLNDGPGGGPGTLLGGVTFGATTFNPQSVNGFSTQDADGPVNDPWFFIPTPDLAILPDNATLWAGITFDNAGNTTGATVAQLNQLGIVLNDNPLIGSSPNSLFRTTNPGPNFISNPAGSFITAGDNPGNPAGTLSNWVFILNTWAVTATLDYPGAIPGDTTNFGADFVGADWFNSAGVLVHRNTLTRNPGIVNPTTGEVAFGLFDPDPNGNTNPTTGVDPDGTADDTSVTDGTYTVIIYGANTLRRRINNVVVSSAATAVLDLGTVTLLSGNINGDDTVDFSDFELFLNAFGLNFGDTGYDELADFNRDGTVDFTDFEIFLNTFGLNGDPNP